MRMMIKLRHSTKPQWKSTFCSMDGIKKKNIIVDTMRNTFESHLNWLVFVLNLKGFIVDYLSVINY